MSEVVWCRNFEDHEWRRTWREQDGRFFMVPMFLEDGGKPMVEVQCTRCPVTTRMLLEEFERYP